MAGSQCASVICFIQRNLCRLPAKRDKAGGLDRAAEMSYAEHVFGSTEGRLCAARAALSFYTPSRGVRSI